MKKIFYKSFFMFAALIFTGCGSSKIVMNSLEYNDPEILKYAACFNSLCAENEMCGLWWDCSEYVNRTELKQNVAGWAETINSCYENEKYRQSVAPDSVFTEEKTQKAVINMKSGWNLGNTLDSNSIKMIYDNGKSEWTTEDADGGWMVKYTVPVEKWETEWGQPVTTKAMIEYVKSLGFNTVRLPVTWGEHLDSENNVDEEWMNRVQEVVDYVTDSGMYCILNVHHDGGESGWIKACNSSFNQFSGRFEKLWKQIAENFEKYDEHLLFESMNEVLDDKGSWDNPSEEEMNVINSWNQLFVDTVRKTGGNNSKRNLIIMGYAGSGNDAALKYLKIPEDSVEGHLILEVHNYNPTAFTWTNVSWAKMTAIFSENAENVLKADFEILKKYKAALNVPVIIGEYAAFRKLYKDYDNE